MLRRACISSGCDKTDSHTKEGLDVSSVPRGMGETDGASFHPREELSAVQEIRSRVNMDCAPLKAPSLEPQTTYTHHHHHHQ